LSEKQQSDNLPFLEHEIVCEQQFKSSNVFNCEIVEEGNKSSQEANKKHQSPLQNNVLKYLQLLSCPPVLLKKVILYNSETSKIFKDVTRSNDIKMCCISEI
jgi:hypothetical protein